MSVSDDEAGDAQRRRRTLIGIGLLLCGAQLLPLVDGLAKWLGATVPVLLIVWGRYTFHLLAVLPVAIWRHGRTAVLPPRLALQLMRGALLLTCTLLFFEALRTLPVADAIALIFVYPFVVTMLSPWLLGEPVGVRRWSAVTAGFVGVLFIVRPGGDVDPAGTPLALLAGSLFGIYVLVTRRLAGAAPPLVGMSFTAVVGALVMNAALPWIWQPLEWQAVAILALMGVLVAAGHGAIMRAYELAPAPVLAPLGYSEIVGATLVGLWMFGDFPQPLTWLGIGIIVSSGVYITWRERRRGVTVNPKESVPG